MTLSPAPRLVIAASIGLAILAPTGLAIGADPAPELRAPPDPPPAAALTGDHPALETRWVRTFAAGERLRAEPDRRARAIGESPSARIAARVQRVARDDDGRIWARVAYPGARRGWVAARDLRSVPELAPLAPWVRRALRRVGRRAGAPSSVVVRDRFGRALYSGGTRRPLVLASVTKLFTVGAALEGLRHPALAREILAPSDNLKAQRLIESLGRGSNGRGTRAAEIFAAERGSTVELSDGSGLDPRNRAAAHEVVDYLQAMRDHPRFRLFKRGLAQPGTRGTLEDRLTAAATRGRVQAKTGTLFTPSTSTVAGYLQPRRAGDANRELTFAILMNGTPYLSARPLQDAMLRLLIARA